MYVRVFCKVMFQAGPINSERIIQDIPRFPISLLVPCSLLVDRIAKYTDLGNDYC